MKKEEFKNLINECVKEVMLEEKAAKKGKAIKQIKEIADKHGITKDELNEIFGFSAKEKEAKKAKAEEVYAKRYKAKEAEAAKRNDIDVPTYHKAMVDYLISTNLVPGPATYDKAKGKMVSAGKTGGIAGIVGGN
jgi:hypothetical protein